ncbi:DUF4139 domain-containing protein [Sediminicoccus sp. KRV36]|uniref:DUF4139 domain-containing protein n=1 Tax=Sediminicoccus sp. KRV36 TaxID=3133721 RepID=UPI00200D49D2|nr:DUF4139 domain-containing protein [Sediminicoccus rosea]UPY38455.1 DUF4139 domain-containing protein [Sediminicoccus rosea]
MKARLCLAAWLLMTTPLAAQELPVRGVTLSSAGLAQIERGGGVPADAAGLTFRVPLEDVDDILRSLIIADPAGRLEGVRLPAQDLAAEAFRGLPLRPEDFASRVSLLNALRGQRVQAGAVQGRIADASEVNGFLRLSLLTASGLRSVTLRDQDEVRPLDGDLAQRLARAAEALAQTRSADTRQIAVALRPGAAAEREVTLTYVAGAPLWKPSWRLSVPGFGMPGEARLMGWAVVENRTGADWNHVSLSLVSGEAAAFRQRLYAPILLPRRELPVEGSAPVTARADTGARPAPPPPVPMPAPAPAMLASRAAGGAAAMEAPPPATQASAGVSLGRVAFTLSEPVSIRSGETANLPFLDLRLAAERVWWVQGLEGRYPLQAVRLRNETPHVLPGGLATIYGSAGAEAGGFLGDAEIRGMPPGETRLLAFARDTGVQFTASQAGTAAPTGVVLRRGLVLVTQRLVHQVSLAVEPGAARGRMVLDLPARRGETPRFTPIGEGDFGLRVEAVLDAAPTRLDYAWERMQTQQIPLWDTALPEPLPPLWRELNLERDTARLPGGNDRLEALRLVLGQLPPEATGRAELTALVADFTEARRLMDEFRGVARTYATAEANLARARQALEDRSGAEKERAAGALNAASLAVERAGTAADQAWTAWRAAAQKVVMR